MPLFDQLMYFLIDLDFEFWTSRIMEISQIAENCLRVTKYTNNQELLYLSGLLFHNLKSFKNASHFCIIYPLTIFKAHFELLSFFAVANSFLNYCFSGTLFIILKFVTPKFQTRYFLVRFMYNFIFFLNNKFSKEHWLL